MLAYIVQRILRMIPMLLFLSLIVFVIIQLPPGDYLTEHLNRLRASGFDVDEAEVIRLERLYALDKPMHLQYLKWISNIVLHGDFGLSFEWEKPVTDVIGERLMLTVVMALLTTIVVWTIAVPIGVYVSVRQYTVADYLFTFLGFIGVATPGFLLAMVIMYGAYSRFGLKVGGLFSPEYMTEPWSFAKFIDMMKHMWIPVVILGVGGTANLIRTMRATMLDELRKQYVTVARAKGLDEFRLLIRYPVRIALNPMISTIGWLLPWLFSGGTVVAIVLNLPTAGPVLRSSLMAQDMFLAGSYMLISGTLTAVGSLISDILLVIVDPRIRFGSVEGL